MLFVVLLLSCVSIPGLASSRMYPPNEDDFSYDSIYDWRVRKDVRNADVEAYLRQQVLYHIPSSLRRHQGWHPEPSHPHHSPVAAQFQRQHSDFAVPPSDSRFFDPPPLQHLQQPQVFYSRKDVETGAGLERVERERTTTEKRAEEVESTTIETETEEVIKTPLIDFSTTKENILLVALIAGSCITTLALVAVLFYGVLRLQRKAKDAADVEYPAYGVTGPNKEATPTGDRRLAHSAQMYHYQLTKQNIIAMESSRGVERRGSVSEADSEDDENEEGDYTVYECPGLAPTGEMEVKNPLFQDETTPASNDQSKE